MLFVHTIFKMLLLIKYHIKYGFLRRSRQFNSHSFGFSRTKSYLHIETPSLNSFGFIGQTILSIVPPLAPLSSLSPTEFLDIFPVTKYHMKTLVSVLCAICEKNSMLKGNAYQQFGDNKLSHRFQRVRQQM